MFIKCYPNFLKAKWALMVYPFVRKGSEVYQEIIKYLVVVLVEVQGQALINLGKLVFLF